MKQEDVIVRKFREEDYDAVISLWHLGEIPYKPRGRDTRDKILVEITKDTAIFLVAEVNGETVGTVLGTHDGRKGWINRLAVAPEFRHQGIARRLLKEAENAIHNLGIEIIACLIEDYNRVSMDFFQKAGYTEHKDIIYFTKRNHPEV